MIESELRVIECETGGHKHHGGDGSMRIKMHGDVVEEIMGMTDDG